MSDLVCDCGREPTVHIDMQSGPGCLCHIRCECGARGNEIWDVNIPWDDLVEDWNDATERELRKALKMGFVRRDGMGRYRITDLGRTVVDAQIESLGYHQDGKRWVARKRKE